MNEHRLGIIGGMGPQATNTFYQYIIDRTDAHSDQEHLSVLIFSDSDMPDRTGAIWAVRRTGRRSPSACWMTHACWSRRAVPCWPSPAIPPTIFWTGFRSRWGSPSST